MISSCCTLRLKRRSAFSRDSLSWIITSANELHLYSGSEWFDAVPTADLQHCSCVALSHGDVSSCSQFRLCKSSTLSRPDLTLLFRTSEVTVHSVANPIFAFLSLLCCCLLLLLIH